MVYELYFKKEGREGGKKEGNKIEVAGSMNNWTFAPPTGATASAPINSCL